MSAITAWIRALAGAAVFCAIALALCPEGRPKLQSSQEEKR